MVRSRSAGLPPLVRELIDVVQDLSAATEVETVQAVVLQAVRRLTAADGVTFVVRDGDRCFYADEDAIAPLWKGRSFPASACISGWVMAHGQPAVVPDTSIDDRIPAEVYRPTFVRSLAMVPIRAEDPLGAIGVYWSAPHTAGLADVEAVRAIADATAVTLERLHSDQALAARVAELEHANRALADANDRLEDVASVVAHDLRSPLATVDGLLTLLGRQVERGDGASSLDLAGRAAGQVGRLMSTVEALLSLAQVKTDPLVFEDVDLSELGTEVIVGLGADVADADAEVRIGQGRLRGDRALLRLLLQNLISNALRYRDPARRQVVEVEVTRRGAGLELSVTDHGVGIAPEQLGSLFELGGRTGASRAPSQGTGIGLVTCRRIVERHGGTIAAVPRPVGARFVVRIPDAPEGVTG